MDKFMVGSDMVANFLASQIDTDGKFMDKSLSLDLCAMYKLPTLLLLSGHTDKAHRLLNRIKQDFLQPNGDIISYPDKSGPDIKSTSFAMAHFWCYMNGWVAMAAQRLGRFDISMPMYEFCKTFYNPELQAVSVCEAYSEMTDESTVDCLSTAHYGLLCLFMGDVETAIICGETLLKFMASQPDFDKVLICRQRAKNGELIHNPPPHLEQYYIVKKESPNQLYFILGYHGIFMTKLYQATQDLRYLDSAKAIMDFALTCHESIQTFSFSHKVMYAAALVAMETKEKKYKRLAVVLGEYFLSIQTKEGLFCKDFELMDRYDQSAEIGMCLRECSSALSVM